MTLPKEDAPERSYGPTELVPCDLLPMRDQRAVLFHLLYALDAFDYQVSVEAVVDQFSRGFLCDISREGEIFRWCSAIAPLRSELDEEIRPLLQNWKLERISVATRLILRLAIWELKYSQVDISVIINEALELAKSFAEMDAHKFVNGLLDEWLKRNRPEMLRTSVE